MRLQSSTHSKTVYQHTYPFHGLTCTIILLLVVFIPECQAVTLTITATNGSVTVSPYKVDYDEDEIVELIPRPDTGYYFAGWAGDAHGNRLVLNLTMDDDKTIVANFDTWQTPIGIPEPEFGIFETYRMYDDPGNRNPELTYYESPNGGYYTHYIDKTDPNATDLGNPYGTVAIPRTTYPADAYIKLGSVIEIHGQTYGVKNWVVPGTAARPIFVRGVPGQEPIVNHTFFVKASYYIFENLVWDFEENDERTAVYIGLYYDPTNLPWSHITVRACEFRNYRPVPTQSEQIIRVKHDSTLGELIENVVIYRNHFHHCGQQRTLYATGDIVGASVDQNARNVWIIDNLFNDLGGDGVQLDVSSPDVTSIRPNRIFIGRNVFHNNFENAIDLKKCYDVVISQNTAYNFGPDYGGTSPAYRFGTSTPRENVWVLFNTAFNSSSPDGAFLSYGKEDYENQPPADEIYYIGNIAYNCHNSATGNAAGFTFWNQKHIYLLNNVTYHCDRNGAFIGDRFGDLTDDQITIANNIFGDPHPSTQQNYSLGVSGTSDALSRMVMSNNLFYSSTGNVVIRRGVYASIAPTVTYYTVDQWATAYPSQSVGFVEGDPLHVDAANGDFRLQSNSPAKDTGADAQVYYDRFYNLYGININVDFEGNPVPQGPAPDIGAYEYVSSSSDITPPTIISVTVQSPVHILFSEPLDVNSATNIQNYTIDPNITIYSATLQPDLQTVVLTTSAHSANVTYTLTVNGVKDVAGNTMVGVFHTYQYILIANAGADQILTDDDKNGSESVTLDGSDSNDPYSNIVSWVWTDDLGATIPDGETTTATLSVGTHTITLTVTDDNGATDTDTITITVNPGNQAPTADAGSDQTATDDNGDGSESVTLDGSDSNDPDGNIVSWVWTDDLGNTIPDGETTTATLSVGTHTITLTVNDDDGATDTDTVTITVNPGNQAPTADAGPDQTATDDNGDGSEPVTLDGSDSNDPDGNIVSWVWTDNLGNPIPDGETTTAALSVGTHTITLTVTDDDGATDTDTVTITVHADDMTAPSVTNVSPDVNAIQVQLNTLMILDIEDTGKGVDADSVIIKVNNNTVYSGNSDKYSSAYGECYRTGTKADYTFIYQSNERFNFDQTITTTANATDLAGNSMDEYSYSFKTKMRAFGKNKQVNKDNNLSTDSAEFASIVNNNRPKTCCDSKGNIWATWHAGPTSNKDIYINKLTAGSEAFGNSIKLTESTADQLNPAIAVGNDDKLYVAWQDSRRGNWDIYMTTSTDGVNWSAETRITDSNDNQYYPAIAVDSSNNVYIVWEDSRNGNQDIYIGSSNNGFVTKTISQITSDLAYQGEPAIAIDSDNTVYVVWTDKRISGENDIYGAASNNSWTNIPVVTKENSSQSSPAIATETNGSILHLVWVDDILGDNDIFYGKTTGGLDPITGNSIIDDTTGADQLWPAIAVTGSTTDNNLHVFACWQDKRDADDDLYLVEKGSGDQVNVFVGDDKTNTDQIQPAIGIDENDQPYLVWTDNRNMNTDIYYAGSTFIESTALASGNISTSSTTTLQTSDGVSVVVPPGAYPCDIEITISEIKNPPTTSMEYLSLSYEFGPSGIEFDTPVTITIPYDEVSASGYSASVYWYNPLTAAPSQQGITDIETIVISSTPYLRFKTTHFTQFFIGGSVGSSNVSVSGGGGGGGGCSLSTGSEGNIVEFALPYVALALFMFILKWRDRRYRKDLNKTPLS